jgi:hypothetical protein
MNRQIRSEFGSSPDGHEYTNEFHSSIPSDVSSTPRSAEYNQYDHVVAPSSPLAPRFLKETNRGAKRHLEADGYTRRVHDKKSLKVGKAHECLQE